MIQNIAPHKFSNVYHKGVPSDDSIIMYFDGKSVLVKKFNNEIQFPRFSEWRDKNITFTYLFSIDDTSYYLADTDSKISLPGYSMENVELFRTAIPKYLSFAEITAYQLNNWYKNNRFCGKCGSRMLQDTKQRMLYCERCRNVEFPKICPAVIIAVTNGDKLLMSKYAYGTYKKYALLAGFTEIGETPEQTVSREVMEEVGLRVKNIRYYKSQPWSLSGTLLLGFYAELDGDDTITMDKKELSEALWVPRDEIQTQFDDTSLTNEMIIKFKEAKL